MWHCSGPQLIPKINALPQIPTYVTFLWLEECIKTNAFTAPDASIIYKPLPFGYTCNFDSIDVLSKDRYDESMKGIVVSSTGFEENEKKTLMYLTALMGAKYSQAFRSSLLTHLICYQVLFLSLSYVDMRRQQARNMKKERSCHLCIS
jgi:hypothetical protein